MPDFDLATGYVVFKGDVSQLDQDISKAQDRLNEFQKSIDNKGIGGFRAQIERVKELNRRMEESNRQAKKLMNEVQHGKFGSLFRDAAAGAKAFQDRMSAFGKFGVGAGAAAVGAASVASPLAGDTLAGSMKLLTVALGREFVPLVKELSFTIQRAVYWWDNLDKIVKENILSTTRMVAVGGAAALALVGVAKVLTMIKNHPLMAAMGIGVVAGNLINDKLNQQSDQEIAEAQAKNLKKDAFEFVRNDMRTQELKGMGGAGLEEARKDFHNKWVAFENKRKSVEAYESGSLDTALPRIMDLFSGGGIKTQWNKDTAFAQQELEKAKVRFDELSKDKLPRREHMDVAMAGMMGGARGGAGQNMLLGSTGPSSYSSLQDYYRQMNLATTGGSQLEAEIKKRQFEADQDFRNKQLGVLEKIAINTEKAGKAS